MFHFKPPTLKTVHLTVQSTSQGPVNQNSPTSLFQHVGSAKTAQISAKSIASSALQPKTPQPNRTNIFGVKNLSTLNRINDSNTNGNVTNGTNGVYDSTSSGIDSNVERNLFQSIPDTKKSIDLSNSKEESIKKESVSTENSDEKSGPKSQQSDLPRLADFHPIKKTLYIDLPSSPQNKLIASRRKSIMQRNIHKRSQSDFTTEIWDSQGNRFLSDNLQKQSKFPTNTSSQQSDTHSILASSSASDKHFNNQKLGSEGTPMAIKTQSTNSLINSTISVGTSTDKSLEKRKAMNLLTGNLKKQHPTLIITSGSNSNLNTSIQGNTSVLSSNDIIQNHKSHIQPTHQRFSSVNPTTNTKNSPTIAIVSDFKDSDLGISRIQSRSVNRNSPESYMYKWQDLPSVDDHDKQSSFSPPNARADLRDYRREMYLEQIPQKYLFDERVFYAASGAELVKGYLDINNKSNTLQIPIQHSREDSGLNFGLGSYQKDSHNKSENDLNQQIIKRKSFMDIKKNFEIFKQNQKENLKKKNAKDKFLEVHVFVPHQKTHEGVYLVKLKLRSSSQTNGDHLIDAALKQYKKETEKEPTYPHPDGYLLKAALDDGTVDTDWPSISKKTIISTIGCKNFVLVIDKSYNRYKRRSLSESLDVGAGFSLSYLPKKTKLVIDKDCLSVAYLPKCITDILFTINMPDSEMPHGSSCIVPISPDVLIKDLLSVIESRLNLEKGVYDIQLVKENGSRTSIPPELRYQTVRFLEVDKIALLRKYKKIAPSRKSASISDSMDFTFPGTASIDYTEYSVIKINKYGIRQERMLGIDSQYLYNKLPNSKTKTKKFIEQTMNILQRHQRQVERPISTLIKTVKSTKNPLAFTTSFTNGETLHWEAKTKIEAEEIVNTLHFVQKLRSNNSFFKDPSLSTSISMSLA